jgi:hypothetical protein
MDGVLGSGHPLRAEVEPGACASSAAPAHTEILHVGQPGNGGGVKTADPSSSHLRAVRPHVLAAALPHFSPWSMAGSRHLGTPSSRESKEGCSTPHFSRSCTALDAIRMRQSKKYTFSRPHCPARSFRCSSLSSSGLISSEGEFCAR